MSGLSRRLNPQAFNPWIYDRIDDYSHRFEVYYGGAGSGKSWGAFQKITLKAMNMKRRVLVIRKVGTTLKHSVWSLELELLSVSGFLSYCRTNKSDYEIELPNGSLFIFKGLDDPEKVKSIDGLTDIVVEEGTELTAEEFQQLNLRLRGKGAPYKQIYIMFNPISKRNWVYDYFILNPPANAVIIHTTYKDNIFLDDEYRAELENLANRNPAYYKIYALGEFATLDKLVFPNVQKRIVTQAEIAASTRWIGLDFGYTNDPSAIVIGGYDEKKRAIYYIDEYVRKGMLNDEIAEVMIARGWHKDRSYGDSAEPKSIAEIKRLGVNIEAAAKGPDSVIHGLQWMQQCDIVVDPRCVKTTEEFDNYTYKKDKKTGEYTNTPVDTYNHTIDGSRYGMNKFIMRKSDRIKVLDRPLRI